MESLLRLFRYAAKWRGRILIATLYSSLNKLFDIAPEILIGIAVNVVVKREQSFVASLGFAEPKSQMMVLGVATFIIWVCESLFEYLYSVNWRGLAQQIQHALRLDTYDQVQRLDMEWFESNSVGNLMTTLNDDVNQLERFLDTGANEIIQLMVSTVLIGAVFFYLEPTIGLLAVIPVPIIFIGSIFFQRNLGPRYTRVRDAAGVMGSSLANNLSGIATIKAFTGEQRELKRLGELSQDYQQANSEAIRVSSAFIPVIRMAILAGFLCTLVLGGFKVFDGTLTIGSYSILIFLTQRFLWPFTRMGQTVDQFERAMASARRVLNLLEEKYSIKDPQQAETIKAVRGELRFQEVGFAYANGTEIFKGLNLNVLPNTMVALVGGTGSGKTSLVKLLLRFYEASSGQILLDGINIRSLTLNDLRRHVGLVSQDVFMFHGTIRENITYGSPEATDQQIEQAARLSEAHEFIQALPHGYQTLVGERGQKLSGGQRQRISIARVILSQPAILILDEATSAVDNETEAAIQRSLDKVSQNRTTLVIAHRLSTIRHAHEIHVLEKGQVVESGKHEDLIKRGGIYANLWRIQTGELHG